MSRAHCKPHVEHLLLSQWVPCGAPLSDDSTGAWQRVTELHYEQALHPGSAWFVCGASGGQAHVGREAHLVELRCSNLCDALLLPREDLPSPERSVGSVPPAAVAAATGLLRLRPGCSSASPPVSSLWAAHEMRSRCFLAAASAASVGSTFG